MNARRGKKCRFQVEALEGRIALSSSVLTPGPEGVRLAIVATEPGGSSTPSAQDTAAQSERARLADQILHNSRIALATSHSSGVHDQATAQQEIVDTAHGLRAQRSHYGTAPGGSVYLDTRMLKGMEALAKSYTFRVTEIAGGSHSANSRHYAGVAFDVGQINGRAVDGKNPDFKAFMKDARSLGATEVLGPGDKGHDTHVHVAWPRP